MNELYNGWDGLDDLGFLCPRVRLSMCLFERSNVISLPQSFKSDSKI